MTMRNRHSIPAQPAPAHPAPHRWPLSRRLPALLGAGLLAGAGLGLAASPARADCAADIGAFDAVLATETGGASETGSAAGGGMPATEHQEEVLSDDTRAAGEEAPLETAAGDPAGDVEAISPHQREVIRALGEDGVDADTRDSIALIVSEARAALQNGDEAACEAKLEAARALVREN